MAPEQPPPQASPRSAEEDEDDFGYGLFPDRRRGEGSRPRSFLYKSLFTFHHKCQVMLRIALDGSE